MLKKVNKTHFFTKQSFFEIYFLNLRILKPTFFFIKFIKYYKNNVYQILIKKFYIAETYQLCLKKQKVLLRQPSAISIKIANTTL